jgi:hypothetical protein
LTAIEASFRAGERLLGEVGTGPLEAARFLNQIVVGKCSPTDAGTDTTLKTAALRNFGLVEYGRGAGNRVTPTAAVQQALDF